MWMYKYKCYVYMHGTRTTNTSVIDMCVEIGETRPRPMLTEFRVEMNAETEYSAEELRLTEFVY